MTTSCHQGKATRQPITIRKTLLATAIASSLLGAVPAQAQEATQTTNQTAGSDKTLPLQLVQAPVKDKEAMQAFAIPAQALTPALDVFSQQSGVSFAYTSSELKGIQSRGVKGEFTPQQALEALLAGTGVSAQFSGDRMQC